MNFVVKRLLNGETVCVGSKLFVDEVIKEVQDYEHEHNGVVIVGCDPYQLTLVKKPEKKKVFEVGRFYKSKKNGIIIYILRINEGCVVYKLLNGVFEHSLYMSDRDTYIEIVQIWKEIE